MIVAMEPPALQNLRSRPSHQRHYVRFQNTTNRRVEVIWINFEGVKVKYKTMEPYGFFDVTSFVSHPWIFRDAITQTKLLVQSKDYYDCPASETVTFNVRIGNQIVNRPTKALVRITLPPQMYSLKDWAFQAIQKSLVSFEDVEKLELPYELEQELRKKCSVASRVR